MPIDKEIMDQILKDIQLSGASTEENKVVHSVLGSKANLNHILNLSSGLPKIRTNVIDRFNLILSQPLSLQALSSLEIRCCLCRKVIAYPAWYYLVKYAVNHFHYFICFDGSSPNKPTTHCYKR